jgi:hypothetical protein
MYERYQPPFELHRKIDKRGSMRRDAFVLHYECQVECHGNQDRYAAKIGGTEEKSVRELKRG